jgi:3-phenylpropionate/trans-cinnamate dioxygenase ferredoxin subunit
MTQTAAAAEWINVDDLHELSEDTAVPHEAERALCLALSRGRGYAIVDECGHGRVRLSEGDVEAGTVECFLGARP